MALSILESDRIDRYEFEIFIGEINILGYKSNVLDNCNSSNKNDVDKSGLKQEESSKPKYTIKTVLDNIIQVDISSYDKVEEDLEDQCLTYYDDSQSNESLTNIVKNLTERYIVKDKPIRNVQNICFDVAYKGNDNNVLISMKPTVNRGVICIFACVPKTLVTILQKNPLELVICEDLTGDQIELGKVSITLSSSMGFTGAIGYHFYEKGYDLHAHTIERVYEVKDMNSSEAIGDMFVRLKLTCHGPETMQVNQIVLKSNQLELQPIFNDTDSFDFYFDKHIIQSPPKMMYDTVNKCDDKIQILNPEIKELLDCQRVQEAEENEPCVCPCIGLLENVKAVLFDDKKQDVLMCKSASSLNLVCSVKTCGSANLDKI